MSCFNTLGFYCNVTSIKIVSNRGIGCREFNPNSQPVRNKNKENTRKKKKKLHAQDSIYVIRQFAYIHQVAGIYQGKIQSTATVFLSLKNTTTTPKKP